MPFLQDKFIDTASAFSPDGLWLAYQSNETGKDEVYVRAFPPPSYGQGGKWMISNTGGENPVWSRGTGPGSRSASPPAVAQMYPGAAARF